ncbi:Uncharacterised protein [Streptococcus pneumoniae]|uniref:hypothetical protein n=1 Tax=Stutzerimonas stutzeri TaxID=316 RepID=UPI0005E2412F|nr:hypothetical protein [Stutzerimonas stutzeri]CJK78903.1 Uncharacterised protein [Streptococcus pneumoniae]HAJ88495.1 hypothetical protein [Pseudomonas sp.]RRV33530.1 hypothetical protein EGI94_07730 [Stutzerimonas stutzeri]RRV39447.1 hypothetical protein EGJ12_04420 [Stutzerimonas stutzeri]RRW14290.1 hypothetical protein EGJ71_08735 [Stutzerimonas stutzeri]
MSTMTSTDRRAAFAQMGIDDGFIGYLVSIYEPDIDFTTSIPAVSLFGLAAELAEMLREVYPLAVVSVYQCGLFSGQRAETEAVTERIKRRVIEARDAVSPGRAFLEGIGYRFDKE